MKIKGIFFFSGLSKTNNNRWREKVYFIQIIQLQLLPILLKTRKEEEIEFSFSLEIQLKERSLFQTTKCRFSLVYYINIMQVLRILFHNKNSIYILIL